jgi:ABC-type transport system involved in multi-copper enzyme maturation permease subunit
LRGLLRADWLRFRKRRGLQLIVIAVPLLASFFFLTSYRSNADSVPPFDPQAFRQELIDEGAVQGATPEEATQMLDQLVDSQRQQTIQMQAQQDLFLSRFAFPESIVTVLGSASFVFFALVLLTATTIGDEFSWGTIRTSLLASSDRRRLLLVRLAVLVGIAVVLFTIIVLLGILLPALLVAGGATFKPGPTVDPGALVVLVAGNLVVAATVICFAALGTLIVRSGSLTLVVVLAYVAIEAAALALLLRFKEFQQAGAFEWTLNLLPGHGSVALFTAASRAAGGMPDYLDEVVVRDLGAAALPLAALTVWAVLFAALAFGRFTRMDIVD